jgi:hypothetical protein
MKKMILLFALTIAITSNTLAQKDLYESAWVDQQREMTLLTIVKENGSFWLNGYFGKREILKGKKAYVTINEQEYPIEIDRTNGILIFNGVKHIPEFKSRKRQFSGRWQSADKETIFEIKLANGGITWDIVKEGNKPIRFYPKFTETGFTFTFGDEQLFYTLKDGIMTDSKGNRYIHITRI